MFRSDFGRIKITFVMFFLVNFGHDETGLGHSKITLKHILSLINVVSFSYTNLILLSRVIPYLQSRCSCSGRRHVHLWSCKFWIECQCFSVNHLLHLLFIQVLLLKLEREWLGANWLIGYVVQSL